MSSGSRFEPDRPPDVALLVYDLRGSGVCRNAIRLARAFKSAGLTVEILTAVREGGLQCQADGLTIRSLNPAWARFGRVAGNLFLVAPLRRYLEERQPRILLSMGNHVHPAAALAHRLAVCETRLVMRASNDILHEQPGRWWSPLWRAIVSGVALPVLAALFRQAGHVVAVNRELADLMIARLGLEPERVTAIANGVDFSGILERARRESALVPDASGPPLVVAMGRLTRQKNFALLIEAFAQVRRARPARLLILGEGSPLQMRRLRRLAARLGVGDAVTLAGFADNPFAVIARADLFVLSSTWEGASNALIEAMACGCPVVATRCPTGTVDIMDGGRMGPLTPVDDPIALAQAMLGRLDQPRDSARLREGARRFDGRVQMRRYEALVRALLADAPVTPALAAADETTAAASTAAA